LLVVVDFQEEDHEKKCQTADRKIQEEDPSPSGTLDDDSSCKWTACCAHEYGDLEKCLKGSSLSQRYDVTDDQIIEHLDPAASYSLPSVSISEDASKDVNIPELLCQQ